MGAGCASAAAGATGWTSPNNRLTLCRERHLLSIAQWRLLPLQFPPWSTVYHYFRSWHAAGVWVQLHRTMYEQVRIAAGRAACPSVVIMDGWKLLIVKRGQRAFKVTGLTWIVERSFAWLGRNRRLSKDYEYRVQISETMLDIAAARLMLNRLA